jgi:hypothetical protein
MHSSKAFSLDLGGDFFGHSAHSQRSQPEIKIDGVAVDLDAINQFIEEGYVVPLPLDRLDATTQQLFTEENDYNVEAFTVEQTSTNNFTVRANVRGDMEILERIPVYDNGKWLFIASEIETINTAMKEAEEAKEKLQQESDIEALNTCFINLLEGDQGFNDDESGFSIGDLVSPRTDLTTSPESISSRVFIVVDIAMPRGNPKHDSIGAKIGLVGLDDNQYIDCFSVQAVRFKKIGRWKGDVNKISAFLSRVGGIKWSYDCDC